MKEQKTKSKKRILYYLILAVSVLLLAAATVLTVYFVSGQSNDVLEKPPVNDPANPDDPNKPDNPDDPNQPDNPDNPDDKPTGGDNVEKYVAPIANVKYSLEYGEIYTNQTLGWSYRHNALDFAADAGTEVYAMADGEVETVSYNDKTGNYIVVNHGDGLRTLYRFVEPVKGLGKGAEVKKGAVIGTVAEAYGSEYKDGTHLHFEVSVNNVAKNPADYFEAVLEEK
ncbi:MAG: M23 family metallopeptidase [Clostridia bacterium]|nr:M23 family metallopeptidase [Clostridia bacterium]